MVQTAILAESGEGTTQYLRAGPQENGGGTWTRGAASIQVEHHWILLIPLEPSVWKTVGEKHKHMQLRKPIPTVRVLCWDNFFTWYLIAWGHHICIFTWYFIAWGQNVP